MFFLNSVVKELPFCSVKLHFCRNYDNENINFNLVKCSILVAGQTEEVDVSYEAGEREQPVRASGITWPAILICAFVLVLTVLIFLRLLDKPERSTASTPLSTVVTGPATPPRISAHVDSNLSPRTPQPFIEYVRRTIDETPYYRRGARRYDPQYTY